MKVHFRAMSNHYKGLGSSGQQYSAQGQFLGFLPNRIQISHQNCPQLSWHYQQSHQIKTEIQPGTGESMTSQLSLQQPQPGVFYQYNPWPVQHQQQRSFPHHWGQQPGSFSNTPLPNSTQFPAPRTTNLGTEFQSAVQNHRQQPESFPSTSFPSSAQFPGSRSTNSMPNHDSTGVERKPQIHTPRPGGEFCGQSPLSSKIPPKPHFRAGQKTQLDESQDSSFDSSSPAKKARGSSVIDSFSGEVPGISMFQIFESRKEARRLGVHADHMAGICGWPHRGDGCAHAICVSGSKSRYVDNDAGDTLVYVGCGPPGLDQVLKGRNLALKNNMDKRVPVRVLRGSKLKSEFAPLHGYRYDGLYDVVDVREGRDHITQLKVFEYFLKRRNGQPPLPKKKKPIITGPRFTSREAEPEVGIFEQVFGNSFGLPPVPLQQDTMKVEINGERKDEASHSNSSRNSADDLQHHNRGTFLLGQNSFSTEEAISLQSSDSTEPGSKCDPDQKPAVGCALQTLTRPVASPAISPSAESSLSSYLISSSVVKTEF